MFSTKTKKYLIAILIFGQAAFYPALAFAQLGVIANTPATPFWVNTVVNPTTDLPIIAAIGAASTANQACAASEAAAAPADTAAQLGIGGLSLISGGASLQIQLTKKIAQIDGFILCRESVLVTLGFIVTPDTLTGQQKATVSNSANTAIASLKTKEENDKAQLNNAQQGFWKTLVFDILLQTTKSVADALVTKLVNNYKIVDFKRYADSVATLVYDNQFIRDEYPNSYDQLMATAILQQPEFRNQVPPAMFVAANAALGFTPATMNPSSPNFYSQMASVGSTQANPYYQHTVMVANVDQAHANALASANRQIAQSAGYKTPTNCSGSLAQQQQITLQTKAANDQLANRQQLLSSLQQAQQNGQNVNQSDLAKAQADYNSALAQWNNIPDAYSSSSPAIVMCEAIASPVNLINKGIDAAFNAYVSPLSQYNNNNLPAFISLIGQVASHIGTSLIFGGTGAAQNASIISENQVATGLAASVNQSLAANAASSSSAAITFVAIPAPGAGANNYQLNWFVDNTVISGADHVTLLGNGIQSTSQQYPLSGSTSVVTTSGGNYTMTVYDINNNIIGGSSTTIKPTYTGLSSGSSAAPAGASAQGTITITPTDGSSIAGGGNVSITCSNLSVPSGSQVVVAVNKLPMAQTIAINNGQCSGSIAVTKANNFNPGGGNTVEASVADSSPQMNQIPGTPDVTVNLSVIGAVLGAFTDQPNLETRGPSIQFNPRGN